MLGLELVQALFVCRSMCWPNRLSMRSRILAKTISRQRRKIKYNDIKALLPLTEQINDGITKYIIKLIQYKNICKR